MDFWISVLEQGMIFGIMALGVFITYKILDFPDLSVDGTFPLGAAVAIICISKGVNPILATALSVLAGFIAGFFTGILHVKCKITNLLSGILIMTALYSVNLRVMGKANISIFDSTTIFSLKVSPIFILIFITFISKMILDVFLKTKAGFILKTTGDNPQLVTSLGLDIGAYKVLGLMVANGLVALSGAVMAQYQGFADIGMGTGIVVAGLASIIFGQTLFKKSKFMAPTTIAIIGATLYKLAMAIALRFNVETTDLKLITAVIVVAALSFSGGVFNFKKKLKLKEGDKSYVASGKLRESIQ